MKIKAETLIKVVKAIGKTQENEISCAGCFDKLEQFVELLEKGDDPAVIMPKVQHHLDMCGNCGEELLALISSMEANKSI
jgi:hypothetical protein